jgi:deoxyribonuclease-1
MQLEELYRDRHRVELYCGCELDDELVPLRARCGYEPRREGVRAQRIEWEHLMPAERFGRELACWSGATCERRRGRACCGASAASGGDPRFHAMEGDMHNLAPTIGELNADRSNRPYGEVPGETRDYGACDFEVDRASGRAGPVELAPSVRGDAARAWLYMAEAYGIELEEEERRLLLEWSTSDPPDAWEHERNALIEAVQGNRNGFIDAAR